MPALNRAQLCAWESSLQMANDALDDPRGGTARFQARLRSTISALREAIEGLKRMESESEMALRQAREARMQLAHVTEHLPIPFLVTTDDGTVLAANRAAGVALNVSSRALLGRNLMVFFDDREAWLSIMTAMRASGVPACREGNIRPRERVQQRVLASLSAATSPDGPAIQWFLTGANAEFIAESGMARALACRHARAS